MSLQLSRSVLLGSFYAAIYRRPAHPSASSTASRGGTHFTNCTTFVSLLSFFSPTTRRVSNSSSPSHISSMVSFLTITKALNIVFSARSPWPAYALCSCSTQPRVSKILILLCERLSSIKVEQNPSVTNPSFSNFLRISPSSYTFPPPTKAHFLTHSARDCTFPF